MFETNLTMVGRLITSVDTHRFPDGTLKATFRVASTERRFDRTSGTWNDGGTVYMTVTCWRALAENAHVSLAVGDPVVVHGRLSTRQYEKDGRRNSVMEMEASAVGPDLSRATASVSRTRRGTPVTEERTEDEFVPSPRAGDDRHLDDQLLPGDEWQTGPLVDHRGGASASVQAAAGGGYGRPPAALSGAGRAAAEAGVEAGVGA